MRTNTKRASGRTTGRSWTVVLGLAALAVVVGLVLMNRDSDPATEPVEAPGLELGLGESDALASCLAFDPAVLATMPVAFQGTVSTVDGSTVVLTVDRWFAGGDASTVSLVGEHQSPALIAGFEFEPGDAYLVSATDGTVNYCGFSGAATPELLAGYEAAFAS